MKNKALCILFITLSVIFEENIFSQTPFREQINVKKVEVFVDNIRESQIEEQISNIARTRFCRIGNAENLAINISIRQRSYYRDIDNRNSLYVHYTLCDKNGSPLFEECFCSEGTLSILSATVQEKQVKKAVRGIRGFLKNYTAEDSAAVLAKR